MKSKTLAFIGVGNMASAILNGALRQQFLTPDQLILFDKIPSQYEKINQNGLQIRTASTLTEAVTLADVIFLSIKPQNLSDIAQEISVCNLEHKVFISIMAGISMEGICKALQHPLPIVRVMPNTPMLIGKGVSALCRNALVSEEDFTFAKQLFSTSGSISILQEDEINRMTAVTSSAVAYVAFFIQAMEQGAKKFGICPENLLALIEETVIGSTELMIQNQMTPQQLMKMVASPKGTTEKALDVFNNSDFTEIVAQAMQACADRADELSRLI